MLSYPACLGLLEFIVDKVLIREDQNIVDDKGNTVLHIATKEVRTQPIVRYSVQWNIPLH